MAKIKPGQISAKRAYDISKSLMDNSKFLKEASFDQMQMSKGIPYNKTGQKYQDIYGQVFSKTERAGIANRMQKQASVDSAKSVGLKSRADAAMAKANAAVGRDTPLPSSEGMMSKITSGLASLFGK
jgi:hypothetical protein